MPRLKFLFLFLLVGGLSLTACSRDHGPSAPAEDSAQTPPPPGPGEGGGGDPDSQEFIRLSRKLARYFQENPPGLRLSFSPDAFDQVVTRLEASIQDPILPDLVTFTSHDLHDQHNVSKVAIFDRTDSSIQVNRPYWTSASDSNKLILVTMEIGGLLEIDLRYETAEALVRDRTALILAMPLKGELEHTPINWHIASSDPDIFARLTENDIIIDGGIIGTNGDSTERVIRFFENPLQDAEWMAMAQVAFARQMPAYLMLRDESGARASLTAFRETFNGEQGHPPAIVTYSLLFSSHTAPVGECAHDTTTLSALDRLKNCFFDVRFYRLTDTASSAKWEPADESSRQLAWKHTFSELNGYLTFHFASSESALTRALRESLLQDFAVLLPPAFKTKIWRETLMASGLRPNLSQGWSPFWKKTSEESFSSRRFVSALAAMARDQVGLYPGHEPRCIAEESTLELAPTDDPRLIPLDELREVVRTDFCLLQHTTDIESILFRALGDAGYIYHAEENEWHRASPRAIPQEPILSQYKLARELATRIVTENLNGAASLSMILKTLDESDLTKRLGVYVSLLPYSGKLGLSIGQTEQLYRFALNDIMSLGTEENPQSPLSDLVWTIGPRYPLTEFVRESLDLAVRHRLISEGLSREYVTRILRAPWLNRGIISHMITTYFHRSTRSEPMSFTYLNQALDEALRRPFFDSALAADFVRSIVKPYYGMFSSLGAGPLYSYVDLNSILVKVVGSGKLSEEDQKLLGPYIPMFAQAAEFERQVRSLTSEAQATYLNSLLDTPANAARLADVIARFLMTTPVSETAKDQLVERLLSLSKDLSDDAMEYEGFSEHSGLLPSIAALPFLVDLSLETQKKIFTFLFVTLADRGENANHARNVVVIDMFDYRHWRVDRMPGAQYALELMAENSTDNGDFPLGDMEAWEFSNAARAIKGLRDCRTSARQVVCADITDPKKILEKIAANPNLVPELRAMARGELEFY